MIITRGLEKEVEANSNLGEFGPLFHPREVFSCARGVFEAMIEGSEN